MPAHSSNPAAQFKPAPLPCADELCGPAYAYVATTFLRLNDRPDQGRSRVDKIPHSFAGDGHRCQAGRRHQFHGSSCGVEVDVHLLTHDVEQSLLRLDKSIPRFTRQVRQFGLLHGLTSCSFLPLVAFSASCATTSRNFFCARAKVSTPSRANSTKCAARSPLSSFLRLQPLERLLAGGGQQFLLHSEKSIETAPDKVGHRNCRYKAANPFFYSVKNDVVFLL